MKNVFFNSLKITYGIVFSLIFALLLFGSGMQYSWKIDFFLSNIQIVGIITTIFLVFVMLAWFYNRRNLPLFSRMNIDIDKTVFALTVILFLVQFYVFYNAFFVSGWDTRFLRYFVNAVLNDGDKQEVNRYFSYYPNNLLISYFYVLLQKINRTFDIFSGKYSYMCVVVVNCAINSLSCWLTYKTTKIFTSSAFAFLAFAICVVLFGFSGWTIVAYSDALALFLPILCIYLYCREYKSDKKRTVGVIGAGMIAVVGYYIKPQCLIVLFAIVIVECVRLLSNFSVKGLVRIASFCVIAVLVSCSVNIVLDIGNKMNNIQIDKNKELGAQHFLMMGANEQTNGVYTRPDVLFSFSYPTVEERKKANLAVFKNRIVEMKGSRLVTHIQRKMLTTFNDGTFAWRKEGSFIKILPNDTNKKVARFFKSVYIGDNYPYLAIVQHFVWIFVLIFSLATVLIGKSSERKFEISLLWLVLLGFVMYEVLFEVRARYVYIFAPVFCALAAIGFKRVAELIRKVILNND